MTDRFASWLESLRSAVYSEPPTQLHSEITDRMATEVAKHLWPGAFVLDIGCGQGPALDWFSQHGFEIVGTSLCDADIEVCRQKGHDVFKSDLNFGLDEFPTMFDLVWARHVLEHTVCPMWALAEFRRVLKPGGILYAEVPAPNTAARHDADNPNHYSVMGDLMWGSLIVRSGFELLSSQDLSFTTPVGPDLYHSFIAKKL